MANTKGRKIYGSEFKAKVALEAVPGIFDNSNKRQAAADKELTDQLYQQIGRLKVDGA